MVKQFHEQDEKIAIYALLNIAQTYCEHGYKVVLVSDFRIHSFGLVMSRLGFRSPVIKLIASDENILRSRVLNSCRPSGYRNDNQALHLNQKIISYIFENELSIDVIRCTLEKKISLVSAFIDSNQHTY